MLRFSEANAKTSNLTSVEGVAKYLTNGRKVYSFDLPSGKTCPGAKECHSFVKIDKLGKAKVVDGPDCQFRCFSASQEAQYPAVRGLREANLASLKKCGKNAGKIARLFLKSIPHNAGVIRLHVSGDFFSREYMEAIVLVAALCPDRLFYFYTKSLHHLKEVVKSVPMADLSRGVILPNLLVTASFGGKYDGLIEELNIRAALVVWGENTVLPIDHTDEHAATAGGDFALLLHGTQPKGSDASRALQLLKRKGSYTRK